MPSTVLPDPSTADALLVGPVSISWRFGSDPRIYLAAGGALLLQVAHPTVGAGVKEHSQFMNETWDRLLRTIDYLNLMVYGGEDAIAVGRRVREMHKQIKGAQPDGSRYHALEPEAYAWVQATLIQTLIRANEHFARRLTAQQTDRFYREYRRLSMLLGVRERDLPEEYADFQAYFDEMARERLERTDSVEDVLRTIEHFAPPEGLPRIAGPAWSVLRPFGTQALRLGAAAVVGPRLRKKLGVRWSPVDEAQFHALGAGLRPLTPLLPEAVRITGPRYLRWRGDAIARGPIAPNKAPTGLRSVSGAQLAS